MLLFCNSGNISLSWNKGKTIRDTHQGSKLKTVVCSGNNTERYTRLHINAL